MKYSSYVPSRDTSPFLAELRAAHTPAAVRSRLSALPAHSYLRDFIYGAIDGAVTTFAIISGVAGAQLSPTIVIVLGAANLLGDGFSMAVGNFLGTRAEQQQRLRARSSEELHIAQNPEGEREEIRQIFASKGFAGEDLEKAVQIITSDHQQWVETMMREELGLATTGPSPYRAAATTFSAFFLVGMVPLVAFLYARFGPGGLSYPFAWSTALTFAALFMVGAFKSRFVDQRWYWGGLEILTIGGCAAGLAYLVGLALKGLV